jgi:hypothetical protein
MLPWKPCCQWPAGKKSQRKLQTSAVLLELPQLWLMN